MAYREGARGLSLSSFQIKMKERIALRCEAVQALPEALRAEALKPDWSRAPRGVLMFKSSPPGSFILKRKPGDSA